jgi:hypothetical protein
MKVKIKKYPTWAGPYQLVEILCFWAKDVEDENGIKNKPDWVFNLGDWLAHTWFGAVCSRAAERWVDYHDKRRVKVHIDPWDTWSMDGTLAHIILPMLKQLKATKHGAPQVDLADVPKHLQPTKKALKAYNKDGTTDEQFFERWDWVMDEMIFAFESKHNDWEEQFQSGEHDTQWIELTEGKLKGMTEMVKGPNDTFEIDWEGRKAYQERISNGFKLFGKYYENLWD